MFTLLSSFRIRTIIFLMLCQIFAAQVNSQTSAKILGTVTDTANRPVAGAILYFFRPNDTTVVSKTITSGKGIYYAVTDTGQFNVEAKSIGFNPSSFAVHLQAGDNVISPIRMLTTQHSLQNVTVRSRKSLIEITNDKIIYNPENDPSTKAESLADLLRKTPLLTVDGEGAVQLNGQSNFKILMNGRETALFAQNPKDALKNFPGAVVSKIEVITNPSAKYDAEGVGGVINIITKKKLTGYNAVVSSYYSNLTNYSVSGSLNAKTGKLGITGFYSQSGSFNKIEGKNFSVTDVLTSAFFTHRTLEGKRLSRNIGGSGNLELSYDIDSFRVLSIYGNVGRFHAESQTDQNVLTEFKSAPAIRSYLLQQSNFRNPAYGGGADWIRKFRSTPDKEFTARFNAQFSRNEGEATGFQDNLSTGRYILNTTSSKNAEYSFQLDYATPINKIRIETGAKSVIRKAASDYLGMIKYNLTDEFIVDPNNANNFRYGQQVYSGYGSLVLNKQNSSFRFGLRAEHTDINGRYFSSHSFVQQHYTNLIPNIQVTARVGSFYTIVASYNLRLQRPFITNLNPFVNNTDSLNISFGNPNLGPQVIHSGSLQARYVDKAFFASAMLTGSYTGNMVIQYASFNPSNGITSLTYDNAGKEYILGLALNVSTPIGKKITAGISSVFRYNYITNRVVVSQHRSGFTSIAFGNFSWKVVGKFTVNASGGTTRNPYTLLNHPQRQYFYQVNLGYRFMHDKFSATVNFNNFHSRYFNIKTVTEDANFKTQNVTTAPYRVIFFGCTYNFGKLKEATSKKRGIVNDDLIQ